VTVNSQSQGLIARTRALAEPTARGARLRQRVMAASALCLLLLGLLVAAGRGRLVLLAFLVVLAVAVLATAVVLVCRLRPSVPELRKRAASETGSLSRAVGVTMALAGRRAHSGLDRARAVARRLLHRVAAATRPLRRFPPSPAERQQKALRLNARGTGFRRSGNYHSAVASHRAALAILRDVGDRRGEALTLNSLALALAEAGLDGVAVANFATARAILGEIDDREREGQVVANLGFVHVRRGRRREAAEYLREALEKLDPGSQEYRRVEAELRRAG
jgi:tetratricopeptide (TPR) repeat protein